MHVLVSFFLRFCNAQTNLIHYIFIIINYFLFIHFRDTNNLSPEEVYPRLRNNLKKNIKKYQQYIKIKTVFGCFGVRGEDFLAVKY